MARALSLDIDEDLLGRAKSHAERHGVSLSRLVESFLLNLTREEPATARPTGLVADLAGLLADAEDTDHLEEDYVEYLARKYA